jgi:hypothetical protein
MADELDRIIERALGKWRANVGPTAAAVAGFEAIRDLLQKHARGSGLKSKAQEFPPKLVLWLPATKRGGHVWEFASVSAVEDEVYFDLYPLGLEVTLRNRVSPALRRRVYRTDDGFRLPGGGKKFLDEIAQLIPAAHEWFQRAIVGVRHLPGCTRPRRTSGPRWKRGGPTAARLPRAGSSRTTSASLMNRARSTGTRSGSSHPLDARPRAEFHRAPSGPARSASKGETSAALAGAAGWSSSDANRRL